MTQQILVRVRGLWIREFQIQRRGRSANTSWTLLRTERAPKGGTAAGLTVTWQRPSFGSSSSLIQDGQARGGTEGEGRQIEIARALVVATIGGPRPGKEDGERTVAGLPLETEETEETGVAKIGRRAPTDGPAAREIEDSTSPAADERPGRKDPT